MADTIAHLTLSDEAALGSVEGEGEELFKGIMEDPDAALAGQAAEAAALTPAQILERWRTARSAGAGRHAGRAARATRVYWGIGEMSVRSLATARLMECWAHGLDCFAALGVEPVDTDRMRHVCYLGYQTLPYAFQFAGREMPAPRDQLRLELTGPDRRHVAVRPRRRAPGRARARRASGPASAVRRMTLADASTLRADGPLAEAALEVAKAYLL